MPAGCASALTPAALAPRIGGGVAPAHPDPIALLPHRHSHAAYPVPGAGTGGSPDPGESLDEAQLPSLSHGVAAAAHTQLAVHMPDVGLDGVRRNAEHGGD